MVGEVTTATPEAITWSTFGTFGSFMSKHNFDFVNDVREGQDGKFTLTMAGPHLKRMSDGAMYFATIHSFTKTGVHFESVKENTEGGTYNAPAIAINNPLWSDESFVRIVEKNP